MVRRDERGGTTVERASLQPEIVIKVDVVEVHDRENSRVGACAAKMESQIGAIEMLGKQSRCETARPFIEITEKQPRPSVATIDQNILGQQLPGLVAPFKE
jgi:hypothetical protein